MAMRRITAFAAGAATSRDDELSVEEPLEIRVNGQPVSITMRTPGADRELAVGFLHGEGLLSGRDAFVRAEPAGSEGNVLAVEMAEPVDTERLTRHFYASSSCGVCGKSSLKALATLAQPLEAGATLDPLVLAALPARLEAAQETFARTGSLHATALFDLDGGLVCAYEDVGRHNAVDKAVGHCLLAGALPLERHVMLVSGRTSFELVQKAVMARIPVVAGLSGPSTLAADLAEAFGVTLIGFLRGERFNIYSHPERLRA